MNSTAKGTAAERKAWRWYEERGYLVGSRRHIGGAADLVAFRLDERPRLAEVKASKTGPYQDFGPKDRQALREEAQQYGAEAELVWWPPSFKSPKVIPEPDWPDLRVHRLGDMAA